MKNISKKFIYALLFILMPAVLYAQTFTLSASPTLSAEQGNEIFKPVAEFLSKATGVTILYHHPDNIHKYIKDMHNDKYDLLFDHAAYVSWRMEYKKHQPLVQIAGTLQYTLFVKHHQDRENMFTLKNLAGYNICVPAPPSLPSLIVLDHFPNLILQPRIISTDTSTDVFAEILKETCTSGVLPTNIFLAKRTPELQTQIRTVYVSLPISNNALTASSRISQPIMDKIQAALLSDEGQEITKPLRKLHHPTAGNDLLISANPNDYRGLYYLIEEYWGFD